MSPVLLLMLNPLGKPVAACSSVSPARGAARQGQRHAIRPPRYSARPGFSSKRPPASRSRPKPRWHAGGAVAGGQGGGIRTCFPEAARAQRLPGNQPCGRVEAQSGRQVDHAVMWACPPDRSPAPPATRCCPLALPDCPDWSATAPPRSGSRLWLTLARAVCRQRRSHGGRAARPRLGRRCVPLIEPVLLLRPKPAGRLTAAEEWACRPGSVACFAVAATRCCPTRLLWLPGLASVNSATLHGKAHLAGAYRSYCRQRRSHCKGCCSRRPEAIVPG